MGISLERFVERHSPAAGRRRNRAGSRYHLPPTPSGNCRTSHQRWDFPGNLRCAMVATSYPSQRQTFLVRSEDVPGVPEKCDRFVIVVLTPLRYIVQR